MRRRDAIGMGAGLLALLGPGRIVRAQPAGALRLVVPNAPGILPDILARLIAANLSRVLDQPVVAENHAGANGIIAARLVARQPADGSVLMLAGASVLSFNPVLYSDLPYDPLNSFTYVGAVADTPFMLVASRRSGFTSLEQLIARARERPGAVSFASVGIGNTTHLAMEMVADAAGIEMLHVPISTANPMTSLVSGEVDSLAGPVSSLLEQVRAGTVVPLAVMEAQRLDALPATPTLLELGLRVPRVPGWYGILGPAGLPEPVTARFAEAIGTAMREPALLARMEELHLTPLLASPAELRARTGEDMAVWGDLIRRKGVRLG
ncbi:Bug family tripartite tricarboxylate transporter substrate binding protein [Roseomonas elaeocarpi]|uniref:Bug family tripartite tricarboxylate transporter substrate binding protein n=1 Tax=Roseomonas elaeocarpi TaxID=907779 RepID=A0ABV6JN21_9PROT